MNSLKKLPSELISMIIGYYGKYEYIKWKIGYYIGFNINAGVIDSIEKLHNLRPWMIEIMQIEIRDYNYKVYEQMSKDLLRFKNLRTLVVYNKSGYNLKIENLKYLRNLRLLYNPRVILGMLPNIRTLDFEMLDYIVFENEFINNIQNLRSFIGKTEIFDKLSNHLPDKMDLIYLMRNDEQDEEYYTVSKLPLNIKKLKLENYNNSFDTIINKSNIDIIEVDIVGDSKLYRIELPKLSKLIINGSYTEFNLVNMNSLKELVVYNTTCNIKDLQSLEVIKTNNSDIKFISQIFKYLPNTKLIQEK